MRLSTLSPGLGAFFAVITFTTPLLGSPDLNPRQSCEFDSASSPACWGDYSLSTDFYDESPDTGVTREYWLEVQNATVSPDGYERIGLVVNGSIPGPTIFADWGDTVIVHVTNALTDNGTSIHFHGIRQNHTAQNDGVAAITQCPTAPGDTTTYTWKATQYGTTWYHSHYSVQAWNGVFGGIVINGPASSPYVEDKGVLFLNDWYYETTDVLYIQSETTRFPPVVQNGLINGTNISGSGGKRFNTTVKSGTSYRFRIINGAMDTMYRFGIDNHTMTVISSDLVPIKPFETKFLNLGMGQRYDVIVSTNQDAGNYGIRAVPQTSCSANNAMSQNITGILNYEGVEIVEPTTTTTIYDNDNCQDETNLVPYLSLNVSGPGLEDTFDISRATQSDTTDTNLGSVYKWTVNNNTFLVDWTDPTLQQVIDGNTTYNTNQIAVVLNETEQWVYFVIETSMGVAHPIHLHGHDVFILATGSGTWDSSVVLNTSNPPRRDVAMLPANGYLVIAYQTDNPGVWLLHCHIGWHAAGGLGLQLVERQSEIAATVDANSMNATCTKWKSYLSSSGRQQEDSGI